MRLTFPVPDASLSQIIALLSVAVAHFRSCSKSSSRVPFKHRASISYTSAGASNVACFAYANLSRMASWLMLSILAYTVLVSSRTSFVVFIISIAGR